MESKEIIRKYSRKKENLLQILNELQENDPQHFIPEDIMTEVAGHLGLPLSAVYGVVTYYSMFSLNPRGKYIIRVCQSLICEMKGCMAILDELQGELGIRAGETTPDGLFTIETSECLGRCNESPGMIVNEHFHGDLGRSVIAGIIDSLKSGRR